MAAVISAFRQSFFLGKPRFTEKNIPDLSNKVVIVTGSNTGIGKEIARLVYSKNATVYLMARSKEKTENAIATIRNAAPKSTGRLDFIQLDLADLSTIKASAEEFLRKESKLHMLFNNAGVGYPQKGSKSKQGYELQLGVNCLGTFTFTQYLSPILVSTAKVSPPASVRVVWASSSACEAISVEKFTETYKQIDDNISPIEKYAISKLGDYLYSAEFAARHKLDGVVSVSLNPGNLHSDFFRAQDNFLVCLIQKILLYPTVFGAYTNLFAAFSPEVTMEKSGCHIAPWGRFWNVTKDMSDATTSKAQGGTGVAEEFWTWSENEVRAFL